VYLLQIKDLRAAIKKIFRDTAMMSSSAPLLETLVAVAYDSDDLILQCGTNGARNFLES
jgi:hypothetical protein